MICSAVFFESNAPKDFLKEDFLLFKSLLTDVVNLEIRSSLSLVLKLSKSPTYPSTIVVLISAILMTTNLHKNVEK